MHYQPCVRTPRSRKGRCHNVRPSQSASMNNITSRARQIAKSVTGATAYAQCERVLCACGIGRHVPALVVTAPRMRSSKATSSECMGDIISSDRQCHSWRPFDVGANYEHLRGFSSTQRSDDKPLCVHITRRIFARAVSREMCENVYAHCIVRRACASTPSSREISFGYLSQHP